MSELTNIQLINIESIRKELSEWFKYKSFQTVNFCESVNPANDPNDDYIVTYEAVFEPQSIGQLRLELWVTNDGFISVGLETRDRVSSRLKISNSRDGFAAGFEPCELPKKDLLSILNMVSLGEIGIFAWTIPIIGLGSTYAVISSSKRSLLNRQGERSFYWLKNSKVRKFIKLANILKYRAWL